jgi:Fe-S-cluster containining protein
LFAAFWIIKENSSLTSLFENIENRKNCIFYNDKNDYHCLIYPARPLLCRAFAFSGVLDKYRNHKYITCKFMDKKMEISGSFVPLMTDAGNAILYNSEMDKPLPLSIAVEKAWQKISFILKSLEMKYFNTDISLKFETDSNIDPDDNHPPDSAPQSAA